MIDRCYTGAILLLALLLTMPALAQMPPTLEGLKATYDNAKKSIDAGFEQQKTNARVAYSKALLEGRTAYQRKGDLDAYLLLEQARKDAESGMAVPDGKAEGLHAGLVQAIGVYQKVLATAEADKTKRIYVLLGYYITNLQDLVKRLMKQEKIDDAKTAKEEMDRAKTERSALPEPDKAAASPPAP